MSQQLLMRFCLVFAAIQGISTDAWAFKRETKVSLQGCSKYFAASGDARFLEVRAELKQKDHEELYVEVKNVPMPPGTTLLIYVSDEEVGRIILDKKRGGIIKLSSETIRHVPKVELGTSVEVTTVQGRAVLR